MSRLEILEFPDTRLRTVAKPVNNFDEGLGKLVDDMLVAMYAANGIGLAATQVNQHIRMLVLDISENRDQPGTYINPEILSQGRAIASASRHQPKPSCNSSASTSKSHSTGALHFNLESAADSKFNLPA